MNDKEMIAFWKVNEKPFGMATCEQRNWLLNFKGPLESYGTYEYQEWGRDKDDHIRLLGRTYRIPADYEPEKRGRWVECEVFVEDNAFYAFKPAVNCSQRKVGLFEAPGMVGFGGVRFYDLEMWWLQLNAFGKDGKPASPVAVRFWVEE